MVCRRTGDKPLSEPMLAYFSGKITLIFLYACHMIYCVILSHVISIVCSSYTIYLGVYIRLIIQCSENVTSLRVPHLTWGFKVGYLYFRTKWHWLIIISISEGPLVAIPGWFNSLRPEVTLYYLIRVGLVFGPILTTPKLMPRKVWDHDKTTWNEIPIDRLIDIQRTFISNFDCRYISHLLNMHISGN